MKIRTYHHTGAYATVDVELTMEDKSVAELVRDYGHETLEELVQAGGLEPLRDLLSEKASEELPSGVCAQCSGWERKWSLDMGDEWELDDGDDAFTVVTDDE
jgi:hypothetical protein